MSVESAVSYIKRMREDDDFRHQLNDSEDEDANWAFIRDAGYNFTVSEFKQAQEVIYQEYGVTPM